MSEFRPLKRKTWTTSRPKSPRLDTRNIARLHHTVAAVPGGRRASPEVEQAFWRTIRQGHINLGKSDIAYSIGVCPSGRVYILRGKRIGGHTCNHNSDSFAIVAAGNYEVKRVPHTMRRAIKQTLEWMLQKNWITRDFKWIPHSKTGVCDGPTACPGVRLRSLMDELLPGT
jgi:hypothetical protein